MLSNNPSLAPAISVPHRLLWLPLAVLTTIYLPALIDLVVDWYQDPNYSHGFFIPLISGWMLWNKRHQLFASAEHGSGWGLTLVVFGMTLFVVANGAAEYFTLRFSFVVTLIGLVWYLTGLATVRRAWFELVFLVFMIPIPYVIYYAVTFPMQLMASKITVAVLNVMGAGAVRQGNIIYLAGTALEVAEACSGMRSLVSLLALGALYAYLSNQKTSGKLILFASTVPIAILANAGRVLLTSVLAYAGGFDVVSEPAHSLLGLVIFVFALLTLFIESAVLRRILR
jgi:exosortase